jgi:subtilisin family serine protease
MIRRTLSFAVVAAATLAITQAHAVTRLAEKSTDVAALERRAQTEGGVAVIVRLAAPSIPPVGPAGSDEGRERAVATVTNAFVTRFFGERDAAKRRPLVKEMRLTPLVAFTASADDLRRLAADPAVERVFQDGVNRFSLNQSVPLIGMRHLWRSQGGHGKGEGTVVAILDTGVQSDHPFLGHRVIHQACFSTTKGSGYGALTSLCPNGGPSQVGGNSGEPCALVGCEHGTHLAGIAAGLNPKGRGASQPLTGIAPKADIVAIKVAVATSSGAIWGSDSDWIAALEYLYTERLTLGEGKRLSAINMSFGSPQYYANICGDHPGRTVIQLLRSANIAVVVAAGNVRLFTTITPPACIPEAIAVGNSTKNDLVEKDSNGAPKVALFAPGTGILSSIPGSAYAKMTGTSQAAPTVAGAFAALASIDPDASVDEILAALVRTGRPIKDTRNGGKIIRPRIQVDWAMRELRLRGSNLLVAPQAPILRRSENGAGQSFTLTLSAKERTERWRLLSSPDWVVPAKRAGTATARGERIVFHMRSLGPKHSERTGWLVFGSARGKAMRIVRIDQQRADPR